MKDFIYGMRLKDFVHPLDDINTIIEVWSHDDYSKPIYSGTIFKCPWYLLYKYINELSVTYISKNIITVCIDLHKKVHNMSQFVSAMSVEGYLETYSYNTLIEIWYKEIKYNKIIDKYETNVKMLFKGIKINCPNYLLDKLLDYHHHSGIKENTLKIWIKKTK